MPFIQRYQIIQALSPDRADRPFAMGVCCWCPHRRFQDLEALNTFGSLNHVGMDILRGTLDKVNGMIKSADLHDKSRSLTEQTQAGWSTVPAAAEKDGWITKLWLIGRNGEAKIESNSQYR